jgi:hypothetical protein
MPHQNQRWKEVLTNHEINIRFLSGKGCIISVGCKQIAFEDNQKAIRIEFICIKSRRIKKVESKINNQF